MNKLQSANNLIDLMLSIS